MAVRLTAELQALREVRQAKQGLTEAVHDRVGVGALAPVAAEFATIH